MGWFLYDDGLGHERVNLSKPMITSTATRIIIIIIIIITKIITTTALTTIIVKMKTRATTTSKIAISEIPKKQ